VVRVKYGLYGQLEDPDGKGHKPEEIIAKLWQVEVMTGQGTGMADAARSIGVTAVTYYRWRSEYGGVKLDQVKRIGPVISFSEAAMWRLRAAALSSILSACIFSSLPSSVSR
jgi:putative transposase